jgi:hypothetical protein
MISISDFMCFGVLAEADDFFKMIGPLLIFGIYIVASLAKGWAKGRQQESEEEEPSELRKAVQKRYPEIHQRQVGGDRPQGQPPRQLDPAPATVHASRPVEIPMPVRQPPQRTYPAHPVQAERHRRPVQQQQNNLRQNRRQRPVSEKTQSPKSAHKRQTTKSIETKSTKPRCAEHSLASMIRQPQNLKTAIILKEILDKPLALRDF